MSDPNSKLDSSQQRGSGLATGSATGQPKPKRSSLKVLAGLLTSFLALWWVLSSVETEKLKTALMQVSPSYLFFAFVLMTLAYFLRSLRWRVFFREHPPTVADSFRCLIVGFFMNNVLPARMGELVRAHLGGKASGQSRSIVLATIAGERLADGICISLMFAILFSFFSGPLPTESAGQVFTVAFFFLLAGLGTLLMLLQREKVFLFLEKLGQIMPGHLSSYALRRIRKFIEGLEPLLEPRRFFSISIWSVVVWGLELYVYSLVANAFNAELSLGAVALFLAVVNFSSLIPAAPGGIGVIEAITTSALVGIGIEREIAFSMVAVQHLIQILVVGIPGAWYFFRQMHGEVPASEDLEEDAGDPEVSDVSGAVPCSLKEGHHSLSRADEAKHPGHDPSIWLSVVIPAYNEEQRISRTLVSVTEYLKERGQKFEVLVVDDGSIDDTAKVVAGFEKLSAEVRLLTYPSNRGKGYAVKFGVLNARGRYILFNDADGASPIEEVERLQAAMNKGAQIAIGSRAMFSKETEIDTVWYRKVLGRAFNGFVNFLVLPGIADTQCGFKLFTYAVAKDLFERQKAEGFSFDVEILFLARKAGYIIAEVPINWKNVPGSKVDLVGDSIAMGLDILKFRLRDWAGAYPEHSPSKEK